MGFRVCMGFTVSTVRAPRRRFNLGTLIKVVLLLSLLRTSAPAPTHDVAPKNLPVNSVLVGRAPLDVLFCRFHVCYFEGVCRADLRFLSCGLRLLGLRSSE